MSKRVYPSEPTLAMWAASPELQKRWATSQVTRPYNEYEALMRTMPHDDPDESSVEIMRKFDAIKRAVNALPPLHRDVIEGLFFEDRGSLRSVGRALGWSKNYISKLRDEALAMLSEDPRVLSTAIQLEEANHERTLAEELLLGGFDE